MDISAEHIRKLVMFLSHTCIANYEQQVSNQQLTLLLKYTLQRFVSYVFVDMRCANQKKGNFIHQNYSTFMLSRERHIYRSCSFRRKYPGFLNWSL